MPLPVGPGRDDDDPAPSSRAPASLGPADQTVARTREPARRGGSYRMILEPRDEKPASTPNPFTTTQGRAAEKPPSTPNPFTTTQGRAAEKPPSTPNPFTTTQGRAAVEELDEAPRSRRADPRAEPIEGDTQASGDGTTTGPKARALVELEPGAEAAPATYSAGDVIAQRYRLVEPIGSGGMGLVWRAKSLALDLDVALKLIRHESAVPRAAERLFKEARSMARVVHPSAVRIFELGLTAAGDPFIVMEFLVGEPLSARLARAGRFHPMEAARIVLPVLGALVVAHREGIFHRDLKPANVMLVEDGRCLLPKLIDFGIVGTAENAWSRKLTTRGMMLGSPIYMAPEQLFGGGADARIDVWAACHMLYELITGERPFSADDSATTVNRVLSMPLPRHEAFDAYPELYAIVRRGMAKLASDRFPNADALGRALAAWAMGEGETTDAAGNALAARWDPPSAR